GAFPSALPTVAALASGSAVAGVAVRASSDTQAASLVVIVMARISRRRRAPVNRDERGAYARERSCASRTSPRNWRRALAIPSLPRLRQQRRACRDRYW